MSTKIVFAILCGSFVLLPTLASADQVSPSPNLYRSLESGKARDAGVLHGQIESVDYAGGMIVIRTSRGSQPVAVLPSTTIYQGDQYATFSDVRRGLNADVFIYEVDGRLVAQMIRLKNP